MSYVVIETKQKPSDAQSLRDYLLEAERLMPQTLLTANVHTWLANYASLIDDKVNRRESNVVSIRR